MSTSFIANMKCAEGINNASLLAEVHNRTEKARCDVSSSTAVAEAVVRIAEIPSGLTRLYNC